MFHVSPLAAGPQMRRKLAKAVISSCDNELRFVNKHPMEQRARRPREKYVEGAEILRE